MLDMLDRLIVRDFVESLPPKQRALAELLMAGHSNRTAAQQLGISGRAARHRLDRIRERAVAD